MEMTRAILVAVALACSMVSNGSATTGDFETGNALWDHCQQATTELYCAGYIVGAVDTILTDQELEHRNTFCLDRDVQVGQLVDTVKLWLRDHPETRTWRATTVVFVALKEKFPCN